MSRWLPCRRRDFIRKLIKLGFNGPYSGTRHQFLIYKEHRLSIPSNSEYSVPQLKMMLNEVKEIVGRQISLNEWSDL
ncbi:MAG: hypothetical protein CVU80_01325 [Elusimicrobia bacterium HGW-Elusimicrobia-4]|nr:MAG: hypothetical protein CVU80_01325 [Elusimicrobia bacterium HGW-Elusimicrobia-4]